MTKLIVSGACGRMGQAILKIAGDDPALNVIGCLESEEHVRNCDGKVTVGKESVPLTSSLDAVRVPQRTVLIDFSSPEALRQNLPAAVRHALRLIVGTTGLTDIDRAALADAAKETAVLVASNMSVGVNLLLKVARQVSGVLADYDLEIVEMHHRHKKDAPSGTALSLAESAAAGRGVQLKDHSCHGRSGMGSERPTGEIGIHAVRGGDVVGEHTVIFAGPGERVELVHKAHSRDTFASGAIRAARWIAAKPAGMYSMSDVLGL